AEETVGVAIQPADHLVVREGDGRVGRQLTGVVDRPAQRIAAIAPHAAGTTIAAVAGVPAGRVQRIARGAAVPADPAEEPTIAAITGVASRRDVRHEDRTRQRDAPAGGVVDGAAAPRASSSAPAAGTPRPPAPPHPPGPPRCAPPPPRPPGSPLPPNAAHPRQAAEAPQRLLALQPAVGDLQRAGVVDRAALAGA